MGQTCRAILEFSRRVRIHGGLLESNPSKSRLAIAIASIIVLSLVLTASFARNRDATDTIKARVTYTTHDPISIASDEEWASSGFPGDGTESLPYIVSGYEITGASGDAINIQGTTSYFVIENCYLHGNNNGIYLADAENGTLTNNNCSENLYDGIYASSTSNLSLAISGNIALWNGGYGLEGSAYPGDISGVISGCNFSGNSYGGISLAAGNHLNMTMSKSNVSLNVGYGIDVYTGTGNISMVMSQCNVSESSDNGMYIDATNCLNMTLTSTNITWSGGYGVEAYARNGDILAFVDACNISDNGWTGLYLWAQVDLNLTMNNTNASWNSHAGGWSTAIELYAVSGSLQAVVAECNLSYNGIEGIYAEAYNFLNMTVANTDITWNEFYYGFSCGIEAYTSNGDLNLNLVKTTISDHADQGIYVEAGASLDLTMSDTAIVRNNGGDYGGYGVEGYADYGNLVVSVANCNISENYDDGLYLDASNDMNITFDHATIAWNEGYGIEAYTNSGSIVASIDGCNVSNNHYSGVYLGSQLGMTLNISGSMSSWNGQSGGGYGYGIEAYASSSILAYIDGCNSSDNFDGGLYLTQSEYSLIANSTFWMNGGAGMNLNNFDYGTISNNTCVSNAQNGMSVSSTGSRLDNNTCARNGGDGMYLFGSSECQIWRNLLHANLGYGVDLTAGTDNTIWNNTFIFNRGSTSTYDFGTVQAYDDGLNFWNIEGDPHGWGNFWSDWTTPDDDNDGIVDSPYAIDGGMGAQDSYPLALPLSGFAKKITGIVQDSEGNPLSSAYVVVTMMDGENPVSSKAAETDSNGMYEVSFDWLEWNLHYSIDVTATYSGVEAYNSEEADMSMMQEVDVAYEFAIPQFGSIVGFLLAGVFVVVIGLILLRKGH